MPRPRIYEEVDKEMKLEELVKMACDLFGPPYDDREKDTLSRRSIREAGRIMHLSEAKIKRMLIEGRWYSTKETRAVRKLMRNGKTDEQIAEELGITTHQVRVLKPYNDSRIYGIGTASAQKSRMYRRRKNKDENSVVG